MKFYKVEIKYWPAIDMASSNTYTVNEPQKPQDETVTIGAMRVHRAYFEDPVEAEGYRQRIMGW